MDLLKNERNDQFGLWDWNICDLAIPALILPEHKSPLNCLYFYPILIYLSSQSLGEIWLDCQLLPYSLPMLVRLPGVCFKSLDGPPGPLWHWLRKELQGAWNPLGKIGHWATPLCAFPQEACVSLYNSFILLVLAVGLVHLVRKVSRSPRDIVLVD